mmetsp:Transcript_63551/g.185806  ORF Transcript_63551/g.185806 Transcript_63551/m.185806 type:complete len:286 (+) Transcript_63551:631-1488(+)
MPDGRPQAARIKDPSLPDRLPDRRRRRRRHADLLGVGESADERAEGRRALLEYIVLYLLQIVATTRHGVGRHFRRQANIGDDPTDVCRDLQNDVVCRGCPHRPQVIRLDLLCQELLKLPVPVRQHVHLTTIEDHLPAVVLGDGGIALVYCDQRIRPQADDRLREVDALLEDQGVALPLVHSRGQQHGVAAVIAQADEAGGDRDDATITMHNARPSYRNVCLVHSHERIKQAVHAGEEEMIPPSLVLTSADVAFLDHKMRGGLTVHHIGHNQCREQTAAGKRVPPH